MNIIYNIGYTLCRWLAITFFSYRAHNSHLLPQTEGFILASNHASYLDPPLIGIASTRAIWFLARKTLLEWPILGPIFPLINVIPVDRDGNDRTALKKIIHLVRSGEGVLLFPEGTRSPDGKLQIARPGVGFVVAKAKAPVVPARIFGSFEALPKNAKSLKFHPIDVCFGEPIHFSLPTDTHSSNELYQQISNQILQAIAAIPPPPRQVTSFS
ncbi:MAG: 1-acyl-sn-glycerol-3-phosphate acyltransferase [Chthoniobacterales bacterium]|nr:1-acyl-sn-glycerol-3-phosphate acyltransferase [Chthoniobacterales bacterium]